MKKLNRFEKKEFVESIIPLTIGIIGLFLMSIAASIYFNFSYNRLALVWIFILVILLIIETILKLKIKKRK
jgi:uncharacterized protein YacL